MKNWGVPEIIARELLHSGQNFRGIYKSIKNDIFGLENNLYLHERHGSPRLLGVELGSLELRSQPRHHTLAITSSPGGTGDTWDQTKDLLKYKQIASSIQ